ncbi:MAG: DUF2076 domain-containing protein [Sphingomonadaceae bacterium]|nr:DUF2076 domain-containing protein [Sphingomonadaceae bacterium]
MDQNESRLIDDLFQKLGDAARAGAPRDPDAERYIAAKSAALPGATYYMAQAIIVAQHALEAGQQRIRELEAQLADAQQRSPAGSSSGGCLSGLFGGGQRQPAPPPQPGYAQSGYPQPGYGQPGPWGAPAPAGGGMFGGGGGGLFGGGGSGFLAGAAQTAAGVAGGVLAAEAIESMFRGGHEERSGLFGSSSSGSEGLFDGGSDRSDGDLHYRGNDDSSFDDDSPADDSSDDSGSDDDS